MMVIESRKMRQNNRMRIDHVSYATSHDQISDVVQRIGSLIGTAFVDGGIHPRFGTRNFTAPLVDGRYVEVVCPLDHPSVETSAFGRLVTKKALEGGGWLSWVISVENLKPIEERLGRQSISGHRKKPDGTEVYWKQIGINDLMADAQLPFFIEWQSEEHPSGDGVARSTLRAINLIGPIEKLSNHLGSIFPTELESVRIQFTNQLDEYVSKGIQSIDFDTPNGVITID